MEVRSASQQDRQLLPAGAALCRCVLLPPFALGSRLQPGLTLAGSREGCPALLPAPALQLPMFWEYSPAQPNPAPATPALLQSVWEILHLVVGLGCPRAIADPLLWSLQRADGAGVAVLQERHVSDPGGCCCQRTEPVPASAAAHGPPAAAVRGPGPVAAAAARAGLTLASRCAGVVCPMPVDLLPFPGSSGSYPEGCSHSSGLCFER